MRFFIHQHPETPDSDFSLCTHSYPLWFSLPLFPLLVCPFYSVLSLKDWSEIDRKWVLPLVFWLLSSPCLWSLWTDHTHTVCVYVYACALFFSDVLLSSLMFFSSPLIPFSLLHSRITSLSAASSVTHWLSFSESLPFQPMYSILTLNLTCYPLLPLFSHQMHPHSLFTRLFCLSLCLLLSFSVRRASHFLYFTPCFSTKFPIRG